MLDRVWWIWQMQDPENRVGLVPGMNTVGMNHPMVKRQMRGGSRPQSAEEVIVDLGWTAPAIPLSKLNDNLGGIDGAMCYVYV
jgi:tyrosinase